MVDDPNTENTQTKVQPSSFGLLASFSPKTGTIVLCVGLVALVLGTFLGAVHNGFVSLDDPNYVTENARIRRGLSWENIRWAIGGVEAGNWHPLTWLSHMADCQLFGINPQGHHLTSVLLHVTNVLLLFVVLRKLSDATGRSFTVAVIFGLHPLRVESVAWIAERKDVLSALFWMLTLWTYAQYCSAARSKSPRRKILYVVTLLFFALGLLAKPMLVTLPFVLLLIDYWPLERVSSFGLRLSGSGANGVQPDTRNPGLKTLILEKIPFFVASAAVSWVTFLVQRDSGAVNATIPFWHRLENALVAYSRYFGKMVYPTNLCCLYPQPDDWPAAAVLYSSLLVLGISTAALLLWRRRPYFLVGWFWFVGTLVPVIGLIQVGLQAMADRYTYIPSIGILIVLVWGAHDLTQRFRPLRVILRIAAGMAVVFCILLTRHQIGYWENGEVLFRHALAVTAGNPLAHHGVGYALAAKGDLPGAVAQYRAALRLNPHLADIHQSLGFVLARQGNLDEAIAEFREALRLQPTSPQAHNHLGVVLVRQGYVNAAIGEYETALKLKPDYAEAHNNLAIAFGHQGRTEAAIAQFLAAIRLQPWSAEFHYNLGNTLFRASRIEEAIREFQQATTLDPRHAAAYNNLGVALTRARRFAEAIGQFEKAVQLKPDYAEADRNLRALRGMKGATNVPGTGAKP